MKAETTLYADDKVLVTREMAHFPGFWLPRRTKTFEIGEISDITTHTLPAPKAETVYAPRDFLIWFALLTVGVLLACGGMRLLLDGLLVDGAMPGVWAIAVIPVGLLTLWRAWVFRRTTAKKPEDTYVIRLHVAGKWVDAYASHDWEAIYRIAEAIKQARAGEDGS